MAGLIGLVGLALPGLAQVPASHGSIAGIVRDAWQGAPLAGVVVTVRGTTLAAKTDAQGRYQLEPVLPGEHSVSFSKSGFTRATVTEVRVGAGQTSNVDIHLKPEFYELEEYEVTAEDLERENVQILFERQSAQVFTDAIGAEQFARYGSSDVAEIMTKVTGTTVVDGKFAVIRGLSDRYTLATLNGAEIPSADPYRKAAQLDLIPSGIIDQVVVSKTFTPDQPAGFTGGALNLLTKSFPEQFQCNFSVGMAYNTQASLNNDFLSYPGGSLDWLAMDDGTRDQPAELVGGVTLTPNQINDNLDVDFAPTPTRAPLDHSFALSVGDTVQVFDRPLGFFAGLTYSHKYSCYEDGVSATYRSGPPDSLGSSRYMADSRSLEEAAWSGMVNLALQPWDQQEISFSFLYAQTSDNIARRRQGIDANNSQPGTTLDMSELHWIERNLHGFQLRGTHEFPEAEGWRTDWLASLAFTSQEEPDLRYFNFYANRLDDGTSINEISNSSLPAPPNPSRTWRDLQEENLNLKLDQTVPVQVWNEGEAKLKVGGFFARSERTVTETSYRYGTTPPAFTSDPATFPNDFPLLPELVNLGISMLVPNAFEGTLDVIAGYGMVELPLIDRLRLSGGVRYEHTTLDPIDQGDWAPGVSLVYELVTNMNLRVSYSHTVARPTFREIDPTASYDPAGDFEIRGNPNLVMSDIENYDLRWEWFPRPGEVIAFSAFYKDLKNPIEKTLVSATGDIITYENRPGTTRLYGFELEARKTLDFIDPLLADFSAGGNFAWIKSEVPFTEAELTNRQANDPSTSDTRPLYDQSPYIINFDLTYDNRRSGTTTSIIFNMAGERIFFTVDGGPDVYEQPLPQLDFIISQSLGKHWKVKFGAKNLLDPEFRRTYGSDYDSPFVNLEYRKGRTFSLSLGYEF
jgi:outer membrane receptor protein involved in Fe transport